MTNQKLCKGFMIERFNETFEYIEEKLFAEYADGRVFATEFHRSSNDFARKEYVWTECDYVPDNAEPIGNYVEPV